ncbi:hypothetical protein ES703_44507 [subsurface metagenome]
MKHIIPILVILLLLSSGFVGVSYSIDDIEQSTMPTPLGNILYVGGNGTGNYSKIQDAINAAWYGDTVFVYDDSSPYYENLQIKRGINLIGEDKNTTVIDGNKQDSVIEILNDDVMVSGFTIQNCPLQNQFQYAVVKINSCQNVTIFDNIISIGGESITHLFTAAIYLKASTDCSMLDNYIFEDYEKEKTMGIVLDTGSSNNLISGNTIAGNYTMGVYIKHECFNNIISENYIHHDSSGIYIYGSDNEVINNRIVNCSSIGIYIVDGKRNTVSGNIISHNIGGLWDGGIVILASNRNIISDNEISYNHPTGVYVSVAYNNVISGNNFIDNEGEGHKEGGNAYFNYNGLHFFANRWKENYWSDSSSGGTRPKIIPGEIQIFIIDRLWINFDWNPAQEPYDIGV